MKPVIAVAVVFGFLSVSGCTKTVYVTTTDAPTAPTSTIIPTTTVVSFSNDLRVAAAACLDSMPEPRLWDSPTWSSGLERNLKECREFRILGLTEKTDSNVLDDLTLDLDLYLLTVEYVFSWGEQCERAAKQELVNSLESLNCGAIGNFASQGLSIKSSRVSRITQNLQALLSH